MKLYFDPKKCGECQICEIVCALNHTGTCNPCQSRVRIGYKGDHLPKLLVCRQCKKAPCSAACPENAVVRDENLGFIVIDKQRCLRHTQKDNHCQECIAACAFDQLKIDPITEEIINCDLCKGNMLCAEFCPTGAIQIKQNSSKQ